MRLGASLLLATLRERNARNEKRRSKRRFFVLAVQVSSGWMLK